MTFRLFVYHESPLASPEQERELRVLFEPFGPITKFQTNRYWKNSLVSFSSTAEARRAKEALNGVQFHGKSLRVQWTRSTKRVIIRGLPKDVPLAAVREHFRHASHVEQDSGDDVAVVFYTLGDAEDAIREGNVRLTGRDVKLSFDFGKDPSHSTKRSDDSRGRSPRRRAASTSKRSRSPTPTSSSRIGRSPSPRKRATSRSASQRERSGRPGSWSPTPTPSPFRKSPSSRRESSVSSLKRSRSRSQPGTPPPGSASKEDGAQQMEPLEQRIEPLEDDVDMDQVPNSTAPPPPVAVAPQGPDEPCAECTRCLGALHQHVTAAHAESPIAIQKAAIRAWFECHYSLDNNDAGGDGVIPVAVSRKTLLGEINAFLTSMQWPTWKTQSAMYKDWFLREVMGLSDDDIRKGRNWSLHYRDGFAPGGHQDNARNQQQRFDALVRELRKYMQLV